MIGASPETAGLSLRTFLWQKKFKPLSALFSFLSGKGDVHVMFKKIKLGIYFAIRQ